MRKFKRECIKDLLWLFYITNHSAWSVDILLWLKCLYVNKREQTSRASSLYWDSWFILTLKNPWQKKSWICTCKCFFSSPEPKAQVSYCLSAPSVVRPSVRRPSVNFHIFNFFSRTAWWILMKLGRDEVLMVPYKCCCFSDRSTQGRIQGGAKMGHGGSPSSRIFFFRPEGYSNKPNE